MLLQFPFLVVRGVELIRPTTPNKNPLERPQTLFSKQSFDRNSEAYKTHTLSNNALLAIGIQHTITRSTRDVPLEIDNG